MFPLVRNFSYLEYLKNQRFDASPHATHYTIGSSLKRDKEKERNGTLNLDSQELERCP